MAHHHDFKIASESVEYLEPRRVLNTIESKREQSRSVHGLLEHAQEELELSLEDDEEQVFGIRNEIRPREPIEPEETMVGGMRRAMASMSGRGALSRLGVIDLGEGGRPASPGEGAEERKPVEKLDHELVVQNLNGADTSGAVAVASLSDGEATAEYHFMLETSGDNPLQARELTIDEGKVVGAHSWWDRFVSCTSRRGCGWSQVYRCWEGSWTDFLWCMVRKCGSGILKCSACATCDCRWWCKWGSGCCGD